MPGPARARDRRPAALGTAGVTPVSTKGMGTGEMNGDVPGGPGPEPPT